MFENHVNTFHFLYLDKNKQYKLYNGQTIALLSNCAERVLLEYRVEAPRQNPYNPHEITKACSTPQLKSDLIVQVHTVGVLFSAPLAG